MLSHIHIIRLYLNNYFKTIQYLRKWMKELSKQAHRTMCFYHNEQIRRTTVCFWCLKQPCIISNYSSMRLHRWIISGSIFEVDFKHRPMWSECSFPSDTHAIAPLSERTSKPCLWYLKHSCAHLLEGYRCDLVTNSISDDYHISITVYRQTGDNERW